MKLAPVALYTLVALLGATAGYLSYRHYLAAPPRLVTVAAPPPAAPSPARRSEAAAPAEAPAPAIPEQVPDIAMADMNGARRSLRALPGRTRLINFWASWCEPCRREIPLLNALQSAHKSEGLSIVGIAVDMRSAVQTFLKATPLHYMVLVGEEDGAEAAQKFGVELALPFTVFADAQNRIVAVKVGELHPNEADAILAQMRELDSGQQSLEATRAAISSTLKSLAIERSKQSPDS